MPFIFKASTDAISFRATMTVWTIVNRSLVNQPPENRSCTVYIKSPQTFIKGGFPRQQAECGAGNPYQYTVSSDVWQLIE